MFIPLKSVVHMNRIVKRDFITEHKFQTVPCLKRTLQIISILLRTFSGKSKQLFKRNDYVFSPFFSVAIKLWTLLHIVFYLTVFLFEIFI